MTRPRPDELTTQRCGLCAADLPPAAFARPERGLLGGRCRICAKDYPLLKARKLTLLEIRTACELRHASALQKAAR